MMLHFLLATLATPSLAYQVDAVPPPTPAANLAADSSIEDGSWVATGDAELLPEAARTGALGLRIARADDTTSPGAAGPSFPATPGRFLASGWLRASMPPGADPNYSAVLEVTWLDAGGAGLSTERVAAVNGETHVWVYRERAVTAPPGTSAARFGFRFNWTSTGAAELDDVALTPTRADGDRATSVDVSLSAAERIFDPGADISVNASVQLREGPEQTVRLHMNVVDSRGRPLTSGDAECQARPDRPTAVTIVAAATDAPSREHLRAIVTTDPPSGGPHEFGLIVIPRPTDFTLDETSPFAFLEGHPYSQRRLGARWQRPNFNWNEREMELAKRYGVTYVGMFNSANQALDGRMSLEDYGETGFGYYSANLLTAIDGDKWALLGPQLPNRHPQYEGFNYMGLGLILLVVCLVARPSSRHTIRDLARRHRPLLLVFAGLTLLAISTRIMFGSLHVASIGLPDQVKMMLAPFRASGRFLWPVWYFVAAGAVFVAWRDTPTPGMRTIILALLALQLVDLAPLWAQRVHHDTGSTPATYLDESRWICILAGCECRYHVVDDRRYH